MNDRFGIRVMEFYGSSEGNCVTCNILVSILNYINLKFIFQVNTTGKMGACGFFPPWNPYLKALHMFIIQVDKDSNPIRDSNGFCIPCKAGEKGIMVGAIGTKVSNQYSGYATDKSSGSNNKIIENLFKTGQSAFNSGNSNIYSILFTLMLKT